MMWRADARPAGSAFGKVTPEAGDAGESTVGCQLGDVDAGDDRHAVGSLESPGEPDLVAVLVDAARALDAEAGVGGVHGGEHGGERVVADRVGPRVGVATVVGEDAGDEIGPGGVVVGAPHVEVGIDQFDGGGLVDGDVGHGGS